ncbi:MAG: CapA family protein [Spirochaetota bacterium]
MIGKIYLILILLLSACSTTGNPDPEKSKNNHSQLVRILFAGDVMLDWAIKEVILNNGIDSPVIHLKKFLDNFDYNFCNLECPISDNGEVHPAKKYIFQGNTEHVALLKAAGINGVSLANNHTLDYGKTGLFNTLENLTANGINFTGAGGDLSEARVPITTEIKNTRFAILAYTNVAYEDTLAGENTPGVAKADLNIIRSDVQKCKSFYDFIIVSLHWGIEYSVYPAEYDIELGHSIIDSGADVIIGHHPHIVQGIEIYKGKPIFYSLGNFIFGSYNRDAKENILVEISFLKNRIHYFRVFPINGNGDAETPFQYKFLNGTRALNTLKRLIDISRPLKSPFAENAVIEGSSLVYRFAGD